MCVLSPVTICRLSQRRITTFNTHKEGIKYRKYCHFPVKEVWAIFSSKVLKQERKSKEGGTGNKDRMNKWEGLQRNTRETEEGDKDKKM